jgi:hypothetical protein
MRVLFVKMWVAGFQNNIKEKSMRTAITTFSFLTVLSGVLTFGSQTADAGGYYYRARSLYITPPSYAYLPVIGQPPIVVYEAVPTYPAPVAGYYTPIAAPVMAPAPVIAPAPFIAPAPAAVVAPVVGYTTGYAAPAPVAAYPAPAAVGVGVGRVRERQVSTPFRNGYRYHVHNAYGPDYTYRVRETPGTVRFTERWSH